MKKLIVRELFWFVFSAVISLFLAFIFLLLLNLTAAQPELNSIEKIFTVQLYLIGWIVSFISIYIFRIIIKGVKIFL